MFMQNIKKICKNPCQSFIKIFHAFFGCLQISEGSEGLNRKFCWLLCVLGVLFPQNSLNFFIRFINHIDLFGISRHFCYFKVCGSHACHGIYFVFHGNTRVAIKYKIYSMEHAIRVGMSEMQGKTTLSRGTNRIFWLNNLNLRYTL